MFGCDLPEKERNMRVNVYNEELTGDVEIVTVTPDTGRTFYGVRVYLASAQELHYTDEDDDRSAVTFWLHKDYSKAEELAEHFKTVTPR